MIRKTQWLAATVMVVLCAACDIHIDVPDMTVCPGHILYENGMALSYVQHEQLGKRAIAAVFDTEHCEGTEGNSYAAYLWDTASAAFTDNLGVAQGALADIKTLDRSINIFASHDTRETASPMAEAVFDLWRYRQSVYIPSVAQMRLLYATREIVNPVIERRSGHPLPLDENDCRH